LLRFSETPGAVTNTSVQGEFTQSILAELGYDPAAIKRLRDEKVVSWLDDAKAAVAA
jgi:crotonobetainyl-CoA:carnitine CoA-transferase CaiB-like acyl-CoA transferase